MIVIGFVSVLDLSLVRRRTASRRPMMPRQMFVSETVSERQRRRRERRQQPDGCGKQAKSSGVRHGGTLAGESQLG